MGISPYPRSLIRLSAEHYNIQNTDPKYLLADVSLRYTLPRLKQDVELTLSNLTNQSTFRNINLLYFQREETTFQLRPRQIILRSSINF